MTFKFLNLAQVFLGLISTAALAETPRQIDIHKAQVFAGDLDMTGREYASFLWSKHEQVRSLTGDVTDPLQANATSTGWILLTRQEPRRPN